MMDKKEREREKAPRRGQAWSYLVLSELGRFYRHAANRSLKTLEGSTRRDRHRYIYIYDPTRQNSQLQESVRISTWRAFFGVEVAHSAREEAGKGWIDACTALHRPVSSREPASNPFIRSARRAWRMDGKSSVGNRVTGCKVMDTATTEFHYDYRARAHTPKNPCCFLLSLPPIPPFSLPRRLSSLAYRNLLSLGHLSSCPYSSPANSTCNQAAHLARSTSPETGRAEAHPPKPHRPSSTASSFVPFRRPLFPVSFCNCNFPCFARILPGSTAPRTGVDFKSRWN